MAKTLISDVIVPEIFTPYVVEKTAELSEFIKSGIIDNDPQFSALASGAGQQIQMPFWQDLDGDDEVIGDSTTLTPGKIVAAQDNAILLNRAKAWSYNDLAGMLAGSDPAKAIGDRCGDYWARRFQAVTLSTLKGVFSVASMAAHILAINAVSGAIGEDNYLTGASFVDASQLMGDAKAKLVAVAMHSAVEASLLKRELIDFIPDSEGKSQIKMFQGKRVIVDDGLPIDTVNAANRYTTYLFGQGALALGDDNTKASEAVEGGHGTWGAEHYRVALGGDSGFINRRRFVLHPRGVKWLNGSIAGSSPTNTELESASNWLRVYEAKNVRLVAIQHNIDE